MKKIDNATMLQCQTTRVLIIISFDQDKNVYKSSLWSMQQTNGPLGNRISSNTRDVIKILGFNTDFVNPKAFAIIENMFSVCLTV